MAVQNREDFALFTRLIRHLFCCFSLMMLVVPPPAAAEVKFRQIAITGDLAPGVADGAEFDGFTSAPALNSLGDVAFEVFLRTGSGPPVAIDNNQAIFGPVSGGGSPLGLVAREGAAAPGVADGADFSIFSNPALNASGDVAFSAELRTGSGAEVTIANNAAIFGPVSGAGSPLGVVAREGAPAPGVADGAEFRSFFFAAPALNASGDVAFQAFLRTGSGAEVTIANDTAIFGPLSGASSPLGAVARTGDPAPSFTDGALFSRVSSPALNASGDVAFRASLSSESSPAVTFDNNDVIFGPSSEAGSPLGVVSREGDPAPGVADGAEFFLFGFDAINASGDVAFVATLRTGSGPVVTVDNLRAIFSPSSGPGSALGLIARGGAPAPGVADGTEFVEFFGTPALNASADVAFVAGLRAENNAATTDDELALFASVDGELDLVLRQGDPFEVEVGGLVEQRTIAVIGLDSDGYNDTGELAFLLQFTDGTSGIFIANLAIVPEPGSLTLLALGGVGLIARRR